jgi:oligopeptide transport system permease protein
MPEFILRRATGGIISLFVVVTLTFFMAQLAPGDPLSSEKAPSPEVRENLEKYWGLSEGPVQNYLTYLKNLFLKFDMGPSFTYQDFRVHEVIGFHIGNSLLLGGIALLIAYLIGVPLGILAAAKKAKIPDYVATSVGLIGICVPNMVMGPLLILVFASWLKFFPTGQWGGIDHLVLPALTLALPIAAYLTRLTRAGMLDELKKDFVRTALAKGLAPRRVLLKHVLRNGITPVLSFTGPAAAAVLTGSIVVEKIFSLPGLGTDFVAGAMNRDYFLIIGTAIVYSSLLILFNIVVDFMYAVVNPRVRPS